MSKALFRLGILLLVFSGCAGRPVRRSGPINVASAAEESGLTWVITDYQGRNETEDGAVPAGEDRKSSIPAWVSAYLERGNSGVEILEEYQDRFAFVAENSGTNFRALMQWQEGFSPELDFARLAAIRMEKRFLSSLTGYPDDEYGSYFEALIRGASDHEWKGPIREDDFWILRQFTETERGQADYLQSETGPVNWEAYDFLILVTVEKSVLASQINALLLGILPAPPLTRDQRAAVNRVRDRFYEGF